MATYIDLATLHVPVPGGHPPATWASQIRENFEWLQANRRVICTSSTRPTGFEGLEIYETDTDRTYIHNGSAWQQTNDIGTLQTYTPTLTQSGSVTKTVTQCLYKQIGRWSAGVIDLAVTGSGTGANAILVGLPSAVSASTNAVIGKGYVFDTSASTFYTGVVLASTTTAMSFLPCSTDSSSVLGAAVMTAALASGDRISLRWGCDRAQP